MNSIANDQKRLAELGWRVTKADHDDWYVATCKKYPALFCINFSATSALADLLQQVDMLERPSLWERLKSYLKKGSHE